MRMMGLGIVLAAQLLALPLMAGTIDNSFGNTLSATNAKGETANWYINADKSYSVTGADGVQVDGTWRIDGASFCATPAGAAESCFTYVDGKAVGDNWDVSDAAGNVLKVSLKAGR